MSIFGSKGLLALAADDEFEHLVQFCSQLLAQTPKPYRAEVYAEFQLPGLCLGIFKPRPDDSGEFQARGRTGMSLCLYVTNLEDAIAHLTKLGYPPISEIKQASHGREVYACDPQGNRLLLYEPLNL